MDMVDYDENTNNPLNSKSKKDKGKKNKTKMKELNDNNNTNFLFMKKINKVSRKSRIACKDKLSNNRNICASSYMKYQKIKPKVNIHNKLFDYKTNRSNKSSNNSISSNYFNNLFIRIPKTLESKDANKKNKTPSIKHNRTTSLNYHKNIINNKNNVSIELSCLNKFPLLHLLTWSLDKNTISSNNSLAVRNFNVSKYNKTKIITKNNYSKNNQLLNYNSNENFKKAEKIKQSYYKKINEKKKQNKQVKNNSGLCSLENPKNKGTGTDKRIRKLINKIKNSKNILNMIITDEKKIEKRKKIFKIKEKENKNDKRFNINKLNKAKNNSMKFTEKQVKQLIKEIIPKNIKKISEVYFNMKNNQKSFTNRKRFSSSQENIFLNNNYNNFISFNNFEKTNNFNNININNKKNNNTLKKSNNLIYYKNIKPGYFSQRRDNEIIDYIQLKMKIKLKTKPITTLQSRDNSKSNSKIDDLSNFDIRKINSYVNIIPNSSNNSISIEGPLINTSKDFVESKNTKRIKNNNNNINNNTSKKVIDKKNLIKIIDNNETQKIHSKKIINVEQKRNKEKEKDKKKDKEKEKEKDKDKEKEKEKEKDKEKEKVKDKEKEKDREKNNNKEKEKNNNKTEHHRRNDDLSNLMLIKNSNENKENKNISILTTMKDSSFYINEQKILYEYIKSYYKDKGSYPDSQLKFYKYGRLLGKGAFGKVNIALHIASGKLVAIKSFNKKKLISKHSKQKIKVEIEALSKIRSPFTTKIYDTFQTDTHILIVMEYIAADLLSFMRKRGKLTEKFCKIIFKQLIKGIKHIHDKNIVHRDIKLDNILLDLSNTVKICDFGVSKFIKEGDVMHEHCGTPAYIAPEIFGDKGYEGFSCDVWSAGVTLYYMLSGYQPFKGNDISEIQKSIVSGEFEKIDDISEEANDLINKMLEINPKKRIKIDEILVHPWIKNINVNNRKNLDLFTRSEKFLLSKYDVCYLHSDPEELIETFTIQNLNTIEEKEEKGNTKSVILAPYNTYITDQDENEYSDEDDENDLEIRNNICRYKGQVQISNIKYELSNNNEFDNGIFKTQNNTILNLSEDSKTSLYNNLLTNKTESLNLSCDDKDKNNFIGGFSEEILKEIEEKVGYDPQYVKLCLKKNEINYATATYFLMLKEKEK